MPRASRSVTTCRDGKNKVLAAPVLHRAQSAPKPKPTLPSEALVRRRDLQPGPEPHRPNRECCATQRQQPTRLPKPGVSQDATSPPDGNTGGIGHRGVQIQRAISAGVVREGRTGANGGCGKPRASLSAADAQAIGRCEGYLQLDSTACTLTGNAGWTTSTPPPRRRGCSARHARSWACWSTSARCAGTRSGRLGTYSRQPPRLPRAGRRRIATGARPRPSAPGAAPLRPAGPPGRCGTAGAPAARAHRARRARSGRRAAPRSCRAGARWRPGPASARPRR